MLKPKEFPTTPAKSDRPKVQLSQKTLPKLPRPARGNRLYFDGEIPGFAVRVTVGGAISFVLNYRVHQRERRYTIGRFPDWSLNDARDEARDLRKQIRKGHDPLNARVTEREAPTIKDLATDYFQFYADKKKRSSSLRNDHYMLDNLILPKLGSLPVASVTARDVESLHKSLRGTPYHANRILALLSKMFALATKWHKENPVWRADNPAIGIEHFPEERRERWLSVDELQRLTAALDAHANQGAANAIRLLLLTGARKGEVLSATWSQFDLDSGIWTKPSAHTKQKKTEHIPVGKEGIKLLASMKASAEEGEEYLFPGRFENTHLENLKKDWAEICTAAELKNARVHDIRHTFASHLVSSGIPIAVVGKLLGHTQSQTTDRYSHLAENPLRKATDRIGKLISSKPKVATRGR